MLRGYFVNVKTMFGKKQRRCLSDSLLPPPVRQPCNAGCVDWLHQRRRQQEYVVSISLIDRCFRGNRLFKTFADKRNFIQIHISCSRVKLPACTISTQHRWTFRLHQHNIQTTTRTVLHLMNFSHACNKHRSTISEGTSNTTWILRPVCWLLVYHLSLTLRYQCQ